MKHKIPCHHGANTLVSQLHILKYVACWTVVKLG